MRRFLESTTTAVRDFLALPSEERRHRAAHAVLAAAHGILGHVLLAEGQWIHAACVLVAALAYRALSRGQRGH